MYSFDNSSFPKLVLIKLKRTGFKLDGKPLLVKEKFLFQLTDE